jgi:hypothetical protein
MPAVSYKGGAPIAPAVASNGTNPNHTAGDTVKLLVDPTTGALMTLNVGSGGGGTSSLFGAVFPLAGTAVGASDGTDMRPLLVDGSGNLKIAGSFSSTPPTSNTASVPVQKTVGSSSGQVLAANAARKGCAVVNTGTVPIYLGLGQTPTGTAYHIVLPACGNANDGSSARWDGTISGVLWTGAVNAICTGGGTCVVAELT